MFGDGALTLTEFIMDERLPLATIHRSVLEWLRGRTDVALFGAQAVNAYVTEPRMTQDVDLFAIHGSRVAEGLRIYLSDRFHIAVRVREVAEGRGYRVFQVSKQGNRHLVDIRSVDQLPPANVVSGLLVVAPPELIAEKVISWQHRRGRPKSGTDWRDVASLLLKFPELKVAHGAVRDRLAHRGADQQILSAWDDLVSQEIRSEEDDDEFI
ncbi:MAG: nucleotidyl transferase AbiEii/AbiGii toxin family protein [Candidatus Xenobia bacterium]